MKKRFLLSTTLVALFIFPIVSSLQGQVDFEKRAIDLDFEGACSVHTADLNNDGYPDITSTAWNAGYVGWYANDGAYPPSFSRTIIDSSFNGASYSYPGDIDSDGNIDIVASAWYGNRISVWWNNGDNPVTWTKQGVDSSFRYAHEAKFADIDGAGGLDIIAAAALDNEVAWWQNNGGNPVQWTKQVVSDSVMGARSVFPVDIEGDGDTDILAAGFDNDDVSVFINDGGNPIVWTEQVIDGNFNGSHWVFSMDMDNDNDMDVLAAAYMGSAIAIWYNDGNNPPQFTKFVLDANFPGALSVVAAKIDEDDFPDVVAGGDAAADVRVYYNDGTGGASFNRILLDPAFYGVWPVWVADLDNDSDNDILASTSTNHDIYWWDNQTFTTGIEPSGGDPHGMRLDNVFPNPFRQNVNINYFLPEKQHVQVQIYSIMGRLIRTLKRGVESGGDHSVVWDGCDYLGTTLPDGIYICRITNATTTDWSYVARHK